MRIATFATAAGLALLGSVALAKSVTYDYDRGADSSRYKTYAWTRGTELTDELNYDRIVRTVDAQLAAKGLTRVEPSARPEVLVQSPEQDPAEGRDPGHGAPSGAGCRVMPQQTGVTEVTGLTGVTAVGHAIELAIAPVFLLSAIGAVLAVLTSRLSRIIDRARVLEAEPKAPSAA